MACISLPPAPPPGPPAPPPYPVPAPPPPVAMPPATPPGVPQVVLDMKNSYVDADSYCYGRRYFTEINKNWGALCQRAATATLIFQNLSKTAPGVVNVQLTANNTGMAISPFGVQEVTVAPGNVQLVTFTLNGAGAPPGWFTITVDTGTSKSKFNLVTTNEDGCGGGGSPGG